MQLTADVCGRTRKATSEQGPLEAWLSVNAREKRQRATEQTLTTEAGSNKGHKTNEGLTMIQ